MGMVVRTNVMAMNANRSLGTNNTQVGKSLEKLSSGFRINRAADDASGLAISEKMKAQIKGLEQASANSQDGISLIQTAEGATQEIHNMLNRMVELATKSANGTIQNKVDREAIQREVDDLNSEITRIASSTNFNGIKLLDGSMGGTSNVTVSAATVNGATAAITTNPATSSTYTATAGVGTADPTTMTVKYTTGDGEERTSTITYNGSDTANTNGNNMTTALKGDKELSSLFDFTGSADTAIMLTSKEAGAGAAQITSITTADTAPAALGAGTATAGENAYNTIDATGMTAGDSVTVNGKTYELVSKEGDSTKTKNAIAVVAGATPGVASVTNLTAAMAKDGITVTVVGGDISKVSFKPDTTASGKGLTLQVGDTNEAFNKVTVKVEDLSAAGLGINSLKVDDQDSAGSAIATIKTAINTVSTNRANLGSLQNRLEYTINNLDTTTENMTSANSRIRDTDMAKEMMNYTKMNILTQAAQAMLAQANQQPQAILQLLQ